MADLNPTQPVMASTNAAAPSAPVVNSTTPDVVTSPSIDTSFAELESMFSNAARESQVTETAPQPTSVAPQAAAATTPVAPAEPSLAEQAASLGLQLPATATDREIAAALLSETRRLAPFAQYGQALAPHAQQLQQFFASGNQPAAAAPAAPQAPAQPASDQWSPQEYFSKLWDAPQLTPQMQYAINNGMVQTDAETGQIVPKPGMELFVAPIIADLNRAVSWKRDQWRSIMDANPYEHFYKKLEDPIRAAAREEVAKHLSQVQQQQQRVQIQTVAADSVNSFEKANADWLFQPAAGGGRMPTEKGQKFIDMARQCSAHWTGDAAALLDLCKTAVLGATAPSAPAASALATPVANNVQQQQSFLEKAVDRASRAPNGGANTIQSPTGPVVVSPGELENMFVNEFRAASHAA